MRDQFKKLSVRELMLCLGVNFKRIAHLLITMPSSKAAKKRADLFFNECEDYLESLNKKKIPSKLKRTIAIFRREFIFTKEKNPEYFLTWSSILRHRSLLA